MDDQTQDPTAMVVVENSEPESVAITPTGLKTDGLVDGVIDLQLPNLLPTDNVTEEREVQVMRTKIPVRITHITIAVIDNGYIVNLPQAGRQHEYHGPDGSQHAFADKTALLEFIGQVVGQVTYQYNETDMRPKTGAVPNQDDDVDGFAVPDDGIDGFEPTMMVQG